MYNTQFNVKYNEIEQELIHNLKSKTPEEILENPDDEHEYTAEDVLDICNKLYRDEFVSVFGAEDITDDKIDIGIKHVYDIMITNTNFKEIIDELAKFGINQFIKNEEISSEKIEGIKQLILLILFSQNIFYITHKCICQQIEMGKIDDDLLVELKSHSIDLLKNYL